MDSAERLNCRFERTAAGEVVCVDCGRRVKTAADPATLVARCRLAPPATPPADADLVRLPKWGNALANGLAWLGITKARYRWLRGRKRIVGGMICWFEDLPADAPTCGCDARQEALNDLGLKVGLWVKRRLNRFSERYGRLFTR